MSDDLEISLESLMAKVFADAQNEFHPEDPDIFQKQKGVAVDGAAAFLDDMTRANLGFRATFLKP
jgi:hypothetical protein